MQGQKVPTLTQQIIRAHQVETPLEGSEYITVEPDLILGHEATIALLIGRLRKAGKSVYDPSRCFFAADHFTPPATPERADILRRYVQFVRDEGIDTNLLYRGISHQLLVEDSRCRPGALIAGADSHTTMGGALGCFAAGFGSTDILSVLATGRLYVKVPQAIAIRFVGTLPPNVAGKDLALEVMRQMGEGGACYKAIEFFDGNQQLSMAKRCTLTNMAVDCGAKNAVFVPDAVTEQYMRQRGDKQPMPVTVDPDTLTGYVDDITIDMSQLKPMVARPGSPSDVINADNATAEPVDQVFIGSCCGGRLEDLQEAAEVLSGNQVNPTTRVVITPASQRVYEAALADGTLATLVSAGAMITNPSCGACGGIDKGILGPEEVCVSTSNRNFRGRMGDPTARIYLASARTAAAAAITGYVTCPGKVC